MKQKSFLKQLQRADEETKEKWLWGLTAFFGTLVILFWLSYINGAIKKVSVAEGQKEVFQPSVAAIFRTGLQAIRQQAGQGLQLLANPREVTIDIPAKQFISEEQFPIKPTPLP